MSREQRDSARGIQGANNVLDRGDNARGILTHTWQALNSCDSGCVRSCECDCDELNLAKSDTCSVKANASLRAVTQCFFNDANPRCDYEIIDVQTSPQFGHIMHPPDMCKNHSKQEQVSRYSFAPLECRISIKYL